MNTDASDRGVDRVESKDAMVGSANNNERLTHYKAQQFLKTNVGRCAPAPIRTSQFNDGSTNASALCSVLTESICIKTQHNGQRKALLDDG